MLINIFNLGIKIENSDLRFALQVFNSKTFGHVKIQVSFHLDEWDIFSQVAVCEKLHIFWAKAALWEVEFCS